MNPLLALIAEVLTLRYTTKIGEKAAQSIGRVPESGNEKMIGDVNTRMPSDGKVADNDSEPTNGSKTGEQNGVRPPVL